MRRVTILSAIRRRDTAGVLGVVRRHVQLTPHEVDHAAAVRVAEVVFHLIEHDVVTRGAVAVDDEQGHGGFFLKGGAAP